MNSRAVAETSPSLALVKYWGKRAGAPNLAATSNLAVGLHALRTRTTVEAVVAADSVVLDGNEQPTEPFLPLFDAFRELSGYRGGFAVSSSNSFPTAAGIASSSSGFAALALALDALVDTQLGRDRLSELARTGSGSASRAVYGGFTSWEAGESAARALFPADHWPQLRVIVAVISAEQKPVGSRAGMERSRETSPFYTAWLNLAPSLYDRALGAVRRRALDDLGPVMRESYLAMFSTMLTARPPFIYWLPASLEVLHTLSKLRERGVPAWETMDAGPQVKILTTDGHLKAVSDAIKAAVPDVNLIVSSVGGDPVVESQ